MSAARFWSYFYEIYEALPRQGPGDRDSTLRAVDLLPALSSSHRVLDIGCGAGAQTLDLARSTPARIVAVDNHEPFLSRLTERATDLGLKDRIATMVGDMNDLRFPDESFDVIWCEGAIFVIGFAKGLATWRRLLTPGGHLVVSELCWLRADHPADVEAFFATEGADIAELDVRRKTIVDSGYRLVGDFVLPATGWWDNYYVPLQAELERFRARHAGDQEALDVAARSQHEIDLYRAPESPRGRGEHLHHCA